MIEKLFLSIKIKIWLNERSFTIRTILYWTNDPLFNERYFTERMIL